MLVADALDIEFEAWSASRGEEVGRETALLVLGSQTQDLFGGFFFSV
jgi:hypothetical protein